MQNQRRVVIDYVSPSVNCGEYYIKRVVNEIVKVRAHVLCDGHDVLGASVLCKHEKEKSWFETRLKLDFNNEWETSFVVRKQGFYSYQVQAWVDYALTWRHGIIRKIDDGQHVFSELLEGAEYVKEIIEKVLKSETFNNPAFFIIQKEVAEKYSNQEPNELGFIREIYADFKILFDIKPGSFSPRPKVMSSFVKFIPSKEYKYSTNTENLEMLIHRSFKMPRKTIKNNLSNYKYKIPNALKNKRATELQLSDYVSILKNS